MTENPGYPLPIADLTKLWLEYGARLHIASIGDDGIAAIGPDAAMLIACDAVAIGASDLMVDRFKKSFLDPEWAGRQIAARAGRAFEAATAARTASADRTAAIFAARFGITDPHPDQA